MGFVKSIATEILLIFFPGGRGDLGVLGEKNSAFWGFHSPYPTPTQQNATPLTLRSPTHIQVIERTYAVGLKNPPQQDNVEKFFRVRKKISPAGELSFDVCSNCICF